MPRLSRITEENAESPIVQAGFHGFTLNSGTQEPGETLTSRHK